MDMGTTSQGNGGGSKKIDTPDTADGPQEGRNLTDEALAAAGIDPAEFPTPEADQDAAAGGGTDTPAPATVELVATGPGRFEGEVADGSFTVLSLSDADAALLGDATKVTIEAAE